MRVVALPTKYSLPFSRPWVGAVGWCFVDLGEGISVGTEDFAIVRVGGRPRDGSIRIREDDMVSGRCKIWALERDFE